MKFISQGNIVLFCFFSNMAAMNTLYKPPRLHTSIPGKHKLIPYYSVYAVLEMFVRIKR